MQTSQRKAYRSDLTDEQWAILEPLIPPEKPGGTHRTLLHAKARLSLREHSAAR